MIEKCYYYDEDGNRCEGEVGPSFEDFPGMERIVSPIPLCDACKKSDFDENDDLTVCKAYTATCIKIFYQQKYTEIFIYKTLIIHLLFHILPAIIIYIYFKRRSINFDILY